jgi:hypothetical protein
LLKKVLKLLTAAAAVVAIAACSEQLDAGKSCPLLCPEQAVNLRDTTIDAIVTDTTISGLPPIGTETFLMLSSHGDTLDTRAIIRFDTIPQSYSKSAFDSVIANIDSAIIIAPIIRPDSLHLPKSPVTIEVYNVDTTGTDTSSAILASLFRPNRLLGSKTFAPDSLVDTLRIPISTDSVLDRVKNGTRLRVGLRLRSNPGYDLRIGTTNSGTAATLYIKASKDTAAQPVVVSPISNTPADQAFLSSPLADFTIVVNGLSTSPATILAVGGVPSRRTYIHFEVPSRIVDSTTVVRASLLLTQLPNRGVNQHDSIYIYPVPILASPLVTNIANSLQFLGTTGQFGIDSVLIAPADSGLRSFEIAGLVRTWKNQTPEISPRSIALRSGGEAQLPGEFDFSSTRGPALIRPRLRITYVPQTSYGVP